MTLEIPNPNAINIKIQNFQSLPSSITMAATVDDQTRDAQMLDPLFSSAAALAKKTTRPPVGDKAPWLFSLRSYHGSVIDTVIAVRISPKNDGPPEIVYKKDIPKDFQGHYLVISCLDDNNNILIENRYRRSGIHLVNPFSSSPWTSTRTFPSRIHSPIDLYNIRKVVTKGDTAVAIAGVMKGRLVYTTSRFDHWKVVRDRDKMLEHGPGFRDLVLWKEDGLFYALTSLAHKVLSFGSPHSYQIRDDDDDYDVIIQDMTLNLRPGWEFMLKEHDGWCCCQDARFVVSPSGLFIVRWRMLYKSGEPKTRQIDVYKLVTNSAGGKTWEKVNSLGNYSFFLGTSQSLAASTDDFPDLKSSCIYVPFDASYVIEYRIFQKDNYLDQIEYNLIYNLKLDKWDKWDERFGMKDMFNERVVWPSVWMMPPPLERNYTTYGELPLTRKREEQLHVETKASASDSGGSSDITMS